MKYMAQQLGAIALAALAGACGEGGGSKQAISPTAPRLVGATTRVTVSCPAQMEYSTTGTCIAYGYDANNTFTTSTVSSWTSSNSSLVSITSTGSVTAGTTSGTATITAVISGVSGTATIKVVPPFTVKILGNSTVTANWDCYYQAVPTGGTPPYTWAWVQGGSGTGYSDGAEGYIARSPSSYSLSATVTDAANRHVTATKTITVTTAEVFCPPN